jgi:hypothetical protein
MNIMETEHTKHRCYFMSVLCGLSLYGWYNYSLFDPVNTNFFTSYYQNCMLMLVYLGWDTYHMLTTPVLFRKDLIIHHSLAFVTFLSFMNICPLQMSHTLIMESISLMNYYWKNKPMLLKIYRLCCIFFIRGPVWLGFWIYYFPTYILTHYKPLLSQNHYIYLSTLMKIMLSFCIYDAFIIWKIIKPKKIK